MEHWGDFIAVWLWGDLIASCQYLKEPTRKLGRDSVWECSDRKKSNGFNLKEGRVRLGIRKKLFTLRMLGHWNMLFREAVDAPFLEAFKARLYGVLSNLVW